MKRIGNWARVGMTIGILTTILWVMIGMKQYTLSTGRIIHLEIRPVDPRDLFRGDYVRLNFGISRLSPYQVIGTSELKRHDRFFLLLEKHEPYWKPVSAHQERPVPGPDQVVIRGTVSYIPYYQRSGIENFYLNAKYGIESYFIPEGEGRALEQPQRHDRLSVRVAVDNRGHAAVSEILINGAVRYRETFF